MKPLELFTQAAVRPPSPDASKPTPAKVAIAPAPSKLTSTIKRHQSNILSLLWSVAPGATVSASKIQRLRANNVAWMRSATNCVQQAGGTCFSLERLYKIGRSEEEETRLLFNKETAHTTLTIAGPSTATMISSNKNSNRYTTVGHHRGIITSSLKLCSLSPSPPGTNSDGMRRNPFTEMFLMTFFPIFLDGSSGRCAPADAVPAMSANGSPGSSKQKMNIVDKPVTVLYADGVKTNEEPAKCKKLRFFPAPLAKELGDSSVQKMNVSDEPEVTVPYDDKVKTYEEPAKRGSSAVFVCHWLKNWLTLLSN
jgi:hypothetical protein